MLGAGIFVFPGLAGGQAGFAAIMAFAIGGLIALAVAACTAELATAMPNSGGGYYFISRSFGPFWGTLVGIAQWIGLVFACAFYLVSFAEYAYGLLEELNISWNPDKIFLSFFVTLLLLLINIMGTKKVGRFQNLMVISLTVILVLIFSYGLVDFFGLEQNTTAFREWVPNGPLSIFTTTALIFTSYLGFVQIANVGGEVKHPSKNLPRSLMWSVALAMGLYIFIMAVCISTFPQERLQAFGETATIEVARELLGNPGAIVVVFAGLLAALSSANASMISASRGVFALSHDALISSRARAVNQRFGTPHIALILVALPVAIMLLKSELEVFAEVASFLHLIIYAGICLSLLKLRLANPIWYIPTFRVRAVKIVAGLAAASCLGLVFFMQAASILIGLGVLVLSAAYYALNLRNKDLELKRPEPRQIDTGLIHPRVLIPVDITAEKKRLPESVLKALPLSGLLLLGFRDTPEQSPSEQSEEEFGNTAEERLEAIRKQLEEAGVNYDAEWLFSDRIAEQFKEVIQEEELRFILMLKPASKIEQLLVPLYHPSQVNKALTTALYNIKSNRPLGIKILLYGKEGDGSSRQADLKQAMERHLQNVGIGSAEYEEKRLPDPAPGNIFRDLAEAGDLILWAEAEPSERSLILDMILEKNSTDTASPCLVLLRKEGETKKDA